MTSSSVSAPAPSPTEQYLALRKAFPAQPGLTPADLANDPQAHAGKTLEIEGMLSGLVLQDDGGASLILSTTAYGTLTLRMSSVATWVQPGSRIRVLCIALGAEDGETLVGMPRMEVVAVASASDLAARYATWQRAQAARRAAEARRRPPVRTVAAARAARSALLPSPPAPGGLSAAAAAVFPSYRNYIVRHNSRLTARQADEITFAILRFSEALDMDPRLIIATIIAESDFRVNETSHKGAMGLIQLMPDEVRRLRLTNPYDPIQNIAGGIYLIKERLNRYSGSSRFQEANMQQILLALASYNAGMGAVRRYGGVPPYRETRGYVRRIERIYRQLCAGDTQG